MKKILFTALMVFFAGINLTVAQYNIENLKISYGEEITDEKGKIVKIIGEANNKVYALGLKGKEYFLKIFTSKEMKLISNRPIVLPEVKDKDVEFEEMILLNGKLYVIGSVYQRKEKIFKLVGIEFSEDGKLSSTMLPMFEAIVEKSSRRGDFYFKTSADETKLLAMHASLFGKEDAFKYDLKLFDANLTQLFANTEKVSFDDNKKDFEFTISDFDVNYRDDAFLVINESYRDSKKKEQIEKFQVLAFKKVNNYKKEVIDIQFKDKEIINCSMISTLNDKVQLVGFYSSVRASGKANKELNAEIGKGAVVGAGAIVTKSIPNYEIWAGIPAKKIGDRISKGEKIATIYSNDIEKLRLAKENLLESYIIQTTPVEKKPLIKWIIDKEGARRY